MSCVCGQFHKRQERDLLDQKKEKEETLLLEMVSLRPATRLQPELPCFVIKMSLCCQEQLERQQNEGKLNSDKHPERKSEQGGGQSQQKFRPAVQSVNHVSLTGRDSKTSLSATKSMSVSSSAGASSSYGETMMMMLMMVMTVMMISSLCR